MNEFIYNEMLGEAERLLDKGDLTLGELLKFEEIMEKIEDSMKKKTSLFSLLKKYIL